MVANNIVFQTITRLRQLLWMKHLCEVIKLPECVQVYVTLISLKKKLIRRIK